jgi:hypothetical protein
LMQNASTTITHVATNATQNKTWSCTEWASRNDFIPLAIKTYSCFHLCFDPFLTFCVHANIACHQ